MTESVSGHTRNAVIENIYPVSEDGKRVSKEVYLAEYYEHPDFAYEWMAFWSKNLPQELVSHKCIYGYVYFSENIFV